MKGYPTDEELKLFIERMEQQELYAPGHMKEQILSRAFPKKTGEELPETGRGEGEVRFFPDTRDQKSHVDRGRRRYVDFLYRVKILAGLAAALFLLLVFPFQEKNGKYETAKYSYAVSDRVQEREDEESVDINYVLNESTRQMNQRINSWFDRLLGM